LIWGNRLTALVQEFMPKRGETSTSKTLGGNFLRDKDLPAGRKVLILCPRKFADRRPAATERYFGNGDFGIRTRRNGLEKIESFEPPQEIIETAERIVRRKSIMAASNI